MTNFQFSQSHINRLAEAGVKWAFYFGDPSMGIRKEKDMNEFIRGNHDLTFRGLLVGTATDLLEQVHGRGISIIFSTLNPHSVSHGKIGHWHSGYPSQEENLIDMIVHLSAKLKAKEEPPVTLDTLNERLTRIERKFQ